MAVSCCALLGHTALHGHLNVQPMMLLSIKNQLPSSAAEYRRLT